MKNFKKMLMTTMAIMSAAVLCAVAFAGCGGKGDEGGNEGGGDKGTLYSIQAPAESDVYDISGLPEGAYKGDTVTFTLELTHPADSVINKVTLSGQTTNQTLTAKSDNEYSFTMPAEPVRLEVDADYYPDNDTDNFLSWDSDNTLEIEKWQAAFEGDEYYAPFDNIQLASTVTSQPSQSPANMALTEHEESVFSLNQSVVPDEALSVSVGYRDGNQANTFTVEIDASKVSAGTAKIVLVVENDSKFSDKATLACTVTVTEPEPLEKVETWTETIVFDLSAVLNDDETENLYFTFVDLNWEDTMYLQQSQSVLDGNYEIAEDGTVTITLTYAVGHSYTVELDYRMSNSPIPPSIEAGEKQNAEYSGGKLTFSADGGMIEFIVG